jgi:glycosyltransferase involved in cell wall biosynthesis
MMRPVLNQGADIAVILLAYNKEKTIGSTIEDFHSRSPAAAIWVINNRSSDATEEIAKNTIARLASRLDFKSRHDQLDESDRKTCSAFESSGCN